MSVTPLSRLAQRDQQMFKLAQTHLDEAKYAKAAKNIDTLSAKYPTCIEMLAVKGLIYRNLPGKKQEGLATIKQALKLDVKSSLAWHTLGTYHKLEGEYKQALNSFKQSLKSDPLNFQILKDISFLHLYLRQYDLFLETRRFMLSCENDSKINWCAIPFALHLAGRPLEAAESLLKWWSFPRDVIGVTSPRWETELRLYLVMLFEEAGEQRRALEHVKAAINYEKDLKNPMAAHMVKGRLELQLGEYEEARNTYMWLIKALPENTDFLLGYFWTFKEFHCLTSLPTFNMDNSVTGKLAPSALSLDGIPNPDWNRAPLESLVSTLESRRPHLDQWGRHWTCENRLKTAWNRGALWQLLYSRAEINTNTDAISPTLELEQSVCDVFDQLATELGKEYDSTTAFPLCILQDEQLFRTRLKMIINRKLTRCSPAVFPITDNLLACSPAKRKVVYSVLEELCAAFELKVTNEAENSSSPLHNRASSILSLAMARGLKATCLVRFEPSKGCQEGLQLLDKAIDTIPTCVALLDLKVTLLTEIESHTAAAEIGRANYESDTADRYLNSQSILTLLRVGKVVEAMEVAHSFNKSIPSKQKGESLDMQNCSYEFAMADAVFQLGLHEQYARRLNLILSRFGSISEEAQDFYLYSLRRGAFRALVDFIRVNNKLHTHRIYCKAATKMIDFCLAIHSDSLPEAASSETEKKFDCIKDEPWPTRSAFNYGELIRTPLKAASDIIKEMMTDEHYIGDFKFNQRAYLVHSRAYEDSDTYKIPVMIRSIRNLWILSQKQIHHPKLFPSLVHFLFTKQFSSEEFSNTALEAELLAEMEIEQYDYQKYLNEGLTILEDNNAVLKDRLAILKALADLIWWHSRNQSVVPKSIELMDISEVEKMLEQSIQTFGNDRDLLAERNSIGDILHCYKQCVRDIIDKINAITKSSPHLVLVCDSLRSAFQGLIKQAYTIRGIQEHLISSHMA